MRRKSMYRRGVQLGGDVAEDVEPHDQQITDALEQRVAQHPAGLGRGAEQTRGGRWPRCCCGTRSAPRWRSSPSPSHSRLRSTFSSGPSSRSRKSDLADRYASWREAYWRQRSSCEYEPAPDTGRRSSARSAFRNAAVRVAARIGRREHHPEVILDHAEGGLSPAHRPLDEGHDVVAGVVQQEPVPGLLRQARGTR